MNKKIIRALYKKEMTDILRDKKTILMMVIMPLVLYPLMFLGSMFLMSATINESHTKTYDIAFVNVKHFDEISESMKKNSDKENYSLNIRAVFSEEEAKNGNYAAYITTKSNAKGIIDYSISFDASNNDSQNAASVVRELLEIYKGEMRERILENMGLDVELIMNPININMVNNASNEATVGSILGYIIPFLLVSSILMGAMYPAIDTTAGEKERGTLETLLTLPVKNIELIVSKFLATSTVASACALLNVASMGILAGFFYNSLVASSDLSTSFSIAKYVPAVLITLLISIVFAMLASAVCLVVCIFAKSFKEAQNYTTPIILVFMMSAMVSIFPNFELNSTTCLIPVVNISLLIADLFTLKYEAAYILYVLLINISITVFAIILMTKLFNSEDILFGDSNSGIHILEKRSDMKKKQMPGIGDLLLMMSIFFLGSIFVGTIFSRKSLMMGLFAQQLTILLWPLLYAWYIKADIKRLFKLKLPSIADLIGAILLFIGSYVIMNIMGNVINHFSPSSAENMNAGYSAIWNGMPLWLLILSSAILPAICEEMTFRGFVFGTLENKYSVVSACIVSGLIFGISHFTLIQLVVVGFMGMVLAYIAHKSGSIIPGALLHCANNTIALLASERPAVLVKYMPFLVKSRLNSFDIVIMIVITAVCIIGGIVLLNRKKIFINSKSNANNA